MAIIKKIEPGGEQLSIETGQVKESPELQGKLSEGAISGSMFIDIGNATTEVAQTLEKAHALAEKTASVNSYRIAQDSVMQKMEENPAYSEEQKTQYINELKAARDEAAKKSTLPLARNEFMADADVQIQLAGHKISKTYNKRMKDEFQANTETLVDGYGNNYATSDLSDTLGREHWLLKKSNQYSQMAESGFITQKEAVRKDIETTKKWDERLMNYQAETNPDMVITELEKKDGGFFKGVSTEARAKGLEKARTEKIKRDKTTKANKGLVHSQVTNGLFMDFVNGNLTQDKLDTALDKGTLEKSDGSIDRTFYEHMTRALKLPKITAVKKSSGYKDVLKEMEGVGIKKDVNMGSVRMKIAQHSADGTLSEDDKRELGVLAVIPYMTDKKLGLKSLNEITKMEEAAAEAEKNRAGMLKNAWNMFQNYTFLGLAGQAVGQKTKGEHDQDEPIVNLMRKFVKQVNKEGITPEQAPAMAELIMRKQRVEDNPNIATLPEKGMKHIDAFGHVATLYPDGRIEVPEEEETPEEAEADEDFEKSGAE